MPPKAGQWTESEKYRFLLQIIKQQGGQKLSIKYDQLDMPGRTPKALSEMWGRIKKEVESTSGGDNDGSAPDASDAEDGAKPPARKKVTKGTTTKPAAKKTKANPKKDVKVTPSKRKAEEVDEDIKGENAPETSDSEAGGVKLEHGNDMEA